MKKHTLCNRRGEGVSGLDRKPYEFKKKRQISMKQDIKKEDIK